MKVLSDIDTPVRLNDCKHSQLSCIEAGRGTQKLQLLWIVLGLRISLFLVELGTGLWTHSLSLLAGSGVQGTYLNLSSRIFRLSATYRHLQLDGLTNLDRFCVGAYAFGCDYLRVGVDGSMAGAASLYGAGNLWARIK